MRRRELLLLLATNMMARPLRAQQKTMPVVGFLNASLPERFGPEVAAFREGLEKGGYIEGKNVAIEFRWAEDRYDWLPGLAAELVRRQVGVIVVSGSVLSAFAAKSATSTIPIVFPAISDPVAAGLVASLAQPGGNLTGFSPFQFELMPKRLDLLAELVPQVRAIALLVNPADPRNDDLTRDMPEIARAKGLQLHVLKAGSEGEIDAAFPAAEAAGGQRASGGFQRCWEYLLDNVRIIKDYPISSRNAGVEV